MRAIPGFLLSLVLFALATPLAAEPAQFEVSGDGIWLPLESGLKIFGPTDRYVWSAEDFSVDRDMYYWQPYPGPGWPGVDYGRTSFSVHSDGMVYMATTNRFLNSGNSSGNWIPEVSFQEDLEAQGWSLVGGLRDRDVLLESDGTPWLLFERYSTAGESFTIRTEKYNPPILMSTERLSPLTSFVINPEESSISIEGTLGEATLVEQSFGSLTASIRGTLLVDLTSPGAISIDNNSRFELLDQPGLFSPDDNPAELAGRFVAEGLPEVPVLVQQVSGAVDMPVTVLNADGSFDVEMTLNPDLGRLLLEVAPGVTLIYGIGTNYFPPNAVLTGKLENLGNQLKLTVPILYQGIFNSNDLEIPGTLQGQIVAYAVVPETNSLLLAMASTLPFVYMGYRQSRRQTRT